MLSWTFGGDPVAELEKILHLVGAPAEQRLAVHLFRTTASGATLSSGVNPAWVVAVVRGDHTLDTGLLNVATMENFHVGLRLPAESQPTEFWPIGHLGPHAAMKAIDAVLIVDPHAAQHRPWITGANERGSFLKNFNWFRECGDRLADPRKTAVAEIANAKCGDSAI
jgi:hypothetical protein